MIKCADSAFFVRSDSPAAIGRTLAAIGRDQPVVHDEFMGAPLLLRHRDVSRALRDSTTFSTEFYGVGPMAMAMVAHSGEVHARQRRIHNQFFSPTASARYAARVTPIAERMFGALAGRDGAELIGDVAVAYPMSVFLDLLGIPDELGDQELSWVRAIARWIGSPMNHEVAEPGEKAFAEFSAYTDTLVENERTNPGDNLLGEIVRAHLREGGFSVQECSTAVLTLLLGGFETTIEMLSAAVASLLFNPDALAAVRADRSLIDAAVDESFRWANPSAGLYRLVRQDVDVAGTLIKEGTMVFLCLAGAHFDTDAFVEPERFDLGRAASHLGFGLGAHYCAGAPLARIEARAALTALLDACPDLRLDPDRLPSFRYGARGFVQHGTDTLHVLLSR